MKDKKCCFYCLNHERVKGISRCKITQEELVNPFESVCKKFICFQCAKHEKEKCECYL